MNRRDLLVCLDVQVETLDIWIEREWLVPARSAGEAAFSATDLARARLIQDLKTRLGVNDEGVDVILHLLDQLHGCRRAFEDMHATLRNQRD